MSTPALLAAAFLFAGTPAGAQEPVRWSSAAYVAAVLELSPEVKTSRENLASRSAELRSRLAKDFFPSFGLSATMNPAELDPGGRFTFDSWRFSANDVAITPSASWNLFNSFQDYLTLRSNQLVRDSTRQDLEQSLQSRALSAVRGYYGLLLRQSLVRVAHQNRKAQREQYLLTKDRYQHGMKSLSDLLKTETDWRSAELGVATEEAQHRLRLFRFNVQIARDEGKEVSFPDDLPLGTTVLPSLPAGLRRALIERPEMKRNRLQLERADVAYRRSVLNVAPSLALDFNYSDSHLSPFGAARSPMGFGGAAYGFTLQLSLPSSFNFYSQVQDLKAANAAWRISRNESETLRRRIREEVYQAHIGLARALRSHEISLRKEDISKQNLDIVKEQYSQGSADVIRLSEALRDYVNAQTERMRAFNDTNISHAEYRVAIGEPIWR